MKSPSLDTAGVIGAQLGDGADEGRFCWKKDLIVDVDGVKQFGADRVSGAHGTMVDDLEREWRSGGEDPCKSLSRRGSDRRKQKKQPDGPVALHRIHPV